MGDIPRGRGPFRRRSAYSPSGFTCKSWQSKQAIAYIPSAAYSLKISNFIFLAFPDHACATRLASNRASSHTSKALQRRQICRCKHLAAACTGHPRIQSGARFAPNCHSIKMAEDSSWRCAPTRTNPPPIPKNLKFCRIYTINYSVIQFLPQMSVNSRPASM